MNGLSFIISSIGNSERLNNLINQIDIMFKNKEIILVDNSKDKKLFEKYSRNKKCKYIHEKNSGSSYARNRGAKESKYEMLIFLDDDIILSNNFNKLDFSLLYHDNKFGLAGGKIIVDEIPHYLPKKYRYLAGEKDYGNKTIDLPKYKYLGGCLLIIKKCVFEKIGGFDVNFGHSGKTIGANEDVLIQDMIHQLNLKIKYLPQASVFHFWSEDESKALEKIKIQGISDEQLDWKYNRLRHYLKMLKYYLYIFLNKKRDKQTKYDIIRYKAYIQNYKNEKSNNNRSLL